MGKNIKEMQKFSLNNRWKFASQRSGNLQHKENRTQEKKKKGVRSFFLFFSIKLELNIANHYVHKLFLPIAVICITFIYKF
jgi:hypothetical protein